MTVEQVPEQSFLIEQMLVGGEKFWMGWAGIRAGGGDGDLGVDIESYGWEADFVVAGLVAKF